MLRIFTVSLVIFTYIILAPATLESMTLGTHFIFGSSLAHTFAENEISALVIGVSSHALLDALPHNDAAQGVQLLTAIGAGIHAYKLLMSKQPDWVALSGGLAGMLPDLEHGLKRKGFISKSYYPSHTGAIRQPKASPNAALVLELGISAIAFKVTF